MSEFYKPGTEAEQIVCAISGTFLLVTISDGRFEKSEEIRLRRGLIDTAKFTGLSATEMDTIALSAQSAFEADYDKASAHTLKQVAALKAHALARRAITDTARRAVVTDKTVTPQEENALNVLARALGLKEGEL